MLGAVFEPKLSMSVKNKLLNFNSTSMLHPILETFIATLLLVKSASTDSERVFICCDFIESPNRTLIFSENLKNFNA